MGWIFVALGVFAVVAAVLDLDFFMESRKARFMVGIMGRNGARVFYVLLGTGLAVLGALLALGIIESSRYS